MTQGAVVATRALTRLVEQAARIPNELAVEIVDIVSRAFRSVLRPPLVQLNAFIIGGYKGFARKRLTDDTNQYLYKSHTGLVRIHAAQ